MDGAKRDWIIAGVIGGFVAWSLYRMSTDKKTSSSSVSATPPQETPKMRFQASRLSSLLKTKFLGRRAICKDTVTSTMTEASALVAAKGAAEANGSVILAEEQTQGIGRRERAWRSAPAGNIYMSFVWSEPGLDLQGKIHRALQLNFACGIAVAKAARSRGVSASVKWPNDVWVGTRKMAGSLVNFDGKDTAIAGVGVNVNQSRESLDAVVGSGNTGTSMVCELGDAAPTVAREDVVADILNEIEVLMAGSLEDTVDQYKALDMLQGKVVRVCHKSREETSADDYDATVVGYNIADGRLRVVPTGKDTGDPSNEVLLSGEEISIKV